jgi:uncharacterized protein (DUF302 family)
VGQRKVSQFLSKQGVAMPHLAICQFCNPLDARLMIIADPVFSSYMPCRISMAEDANGKLGLLCRETRPLPAPAHRESASAAERFSRYCLGTGPGGEVPA